MYQLGAISLPVLVLRGACGRSRALNGVNGHEKWGEEVPRLPRLWGGSKPKRGRTLLETPQNIRTQKVITKSINFIQLIGLHIYHRDKRGTICILKKWLELRSV